MSDNEIFSFLRSDTLIPRHQQTLPYQRLHLNQQPMRNSAPSRLQNFDDFYGNFIDEALNGDSSLVKHKTTSLTNLFKFERQSYNLVVQSTEPCRFHMTDIDRSLTGSMLVPNNSPTDSDDSSGTSPNSPLSPTELTEQDFDRSYLDSTFNDQNNNELAASDRQLSDIGSASKTSLCDGSIGETKTQSENLEGSNTRAVVGRADGLSQLIRRDTFGLEALELETAKTRADLSNLDELTLQNQTLDESVLNSSDEMLVGYDDIRTSPVQKHAVMRSLSDSTAIHGPLRELRRRKSVHFADTKGLDLEIRIPISHLDDYETPPRLMAALEKVRARSRSANDRELQKPRHRGGYNTLLCHCSLILNFQQPFLEPTFQRRVQQQMVCLESVSILPNSTSFTGVIRVVNLEFEKQVTVRYTTDKWRTFQDIPACYVSSLSEFHQDQFSFHVVVDQDLKGTDRIELAICYRLRLSGRELWDNNYGRNYVISCLEHLASKSDDVMMS
ncbi:unnamed protein product [Clavelina lepadiformis]|uniref:CBM21 domain-containing protein n=1 Tax=Clavelina lepadiformis TaxID=159417 RepID=A0ABP0GVY4_CLALP